jgi:hypothetical protein
MDSLEMMHIPNLNVPVEPSEDIDKLVNDNGQDPAPNPWVCFVLQFVLTISINKFIQFNIVVVLDIG